MSEFTELNELIEKLMGVPPITEWLEPKNETEASMNRALAQMYADEGYRRFLVLEMNLAIKNSIAHTESMVDVAFYKARWITLKELLVKARRAYEQLERINSIMKSHGQNTIEKQASEKEGKEV